MKCFATSLRANYCRLSALYAGVVLVLAVLPGLALAQAAQTSGQFNTPWGKSYNDFNQPFDPRTRDSNNNRSIINGRMLLGDQSTLSFGLGGDFFGSGGNTGVGGFGGAGAIGNQLNVVTIGSWNTVIIDSTQINNGNQTVNLDGQNQNQNNNQNPPPPPIQIPPIAADGPYTVGPSQSAAKWQKSGALPQSDDELNGDIQFDD